ncbi:MAG TPA: carboxypeptidase-like regulatory domain-containing protein [Bryobacteraceae bacterium]|nr:carboxypeptidase-like regulatory domain-containing protein [Bryobacteraceae bacterium]
MRRKKTKRNGSRVVLAALILLTVVGLFARDKKAAEPYSIVSGTVFREPGLALQGAEVTITPKLADGSQIKLRITHAISDDRGEFAFRVPGIAATYKVRATAKGFQPDEKTAEVTSEGERVDVTFMLENESNH